MLNNYCCLFGITKLLFPRLIFQHDFNEQIIVFNESSLSFAKVTVDDIVSKTTQPTHLIPEKKLRNFIGRLIPEVLQIYLILNVQSICILRMYHI